MRFRSNQARKAREQAEIDEAREIENSRGEAARQVEQHRAAKRRRLGHARGEEDREKVEEVPGHRRPLGVQKSIGDRRQKDREKRGPGRDFSADEGAREKKYQGQLEGREDEAHVLHRRLYPPCVAIEESEGKVEHRGVGKRVGTTRDDPWIGGLRDLLGRDSPLEDPAGRRLERFEMAAVKAHIRIEVARMEERGSLQHVAEQEQKGNRAAKPEREQRRRDETDDRDLRLRVGHAEGVAREPRRLREGDPCSHRGRDAKREAESDGEEEDTRQKDPRRERFEGKPEACAFDPNPVDGESQFLRTRVLDEEIQSKRCPGGKAHRNIERPEPARPRGEARERLTVEKESDRCVALDEARVSELKRPGFRHASERHDDRRSLLRPAKADGAPFLALGETREVRSGRRTDVEIERCLAQRAEVERRLAQKKNQETYEADAPSFAHSPPGRYFFRSRSLRSVSSSSSSLFCLVEMLST